MIDPKATPLVHSARFRFRPIQPYSFELTVQKPAGWSWFTPYEIWEKGTIWSGFWFEVSGQGERRKIALGVKAHSSAKRVAVDIYSSRRLPRDELARLRDLMGKALGISEDLRPFYRLMRRDRLLRHLVRRLYGMREGWGMNVFSSLTLAILLQMAPIKRSQDMWDCLLKNYGRWIRFDGKSVLIWPDEKTIAPLRPRTLARKCRLGYRARFLVRLARQMVKGFPGVEELAKMTPEDANKKLTELYGVGEYSAGFASPHAGFSLDVWSVKIFYPIIYGRRAPERDPRSAIKVTTRAAEKKWGEWRGYVLTYVLNDLPYLAKEFNIPIT